MDEWMDDGETRQSQRWMNGWVDRQFDDRYNGWANMANANLNIVGKLIDIIVFSFYIFCI